MSAPGQTPAGEQADGDDTIENDGSVAETTTTFLFGGSWDSGETRRPPLHDDLFENVEDGTQLMSLPSWAASVDDMDVFEAGLCGPTVFPDLSVTIPPAFPGVSDRNPLQFASPQEFNAQTISKTLEYRFSYAVEKIQYAPRQMLLELQTPWSHPLLYKDEMPRVMQG